MTSVGVMASSVVSGVCTPVLREPFDNLAAWVVANTVTVVGARTGTGAQFVGTAVTPMLTSTVPAPSESDTVTIGFAFKATSFALATTPMVELRSDAGATLHTQLSLNSSGQIVVSRSGISLGAAAHGMTAGAFSYIEWQVRLHDTLGAAIVRINGVAVLNLTGLDTRNAGTKAVYDTVRLLGTASGVTTIFDDLYLTTGAGCAFQGDQTIVGAAVDELLENFTSVAEWVSGISSVAGGRTGNAGNISGSSNANYNISAPNVSAYATLGFAFKTSDVGATFRNIVSFRDATTTDMLTLRVETTGAIGLYLGIVSGPLGSSATGLVVAATWNYVEIQTFIDDVVGYATVRLNGTTVITFTGDTRSATAGPGIGVLFLRGPGSGQTTQFDDLYLTMGAGAAFKGDITIP